MTPGYLRVLCHVVCHTRGCNKTAPMYSEIHASIGDGGTIDVELRPVGSFPHGWKVGRYNNNAACPEHELPTWETL